MKKLHPAVIRETIHTALGVLAVDAVMIMVFAALRHLDSSVLLGALFGTVFSVLNFFLLGVTVQKALQKKASQRKVVQLSYTLRMLLMLAVMVLGIVLPCFHAIAVIVPFLVQQPVILILRALGISKQKEREEEMDL